MKKKTKKKKKKKFNLVEEYTRCWNFIKNSKKSIYWIVGIFLFFLLIGYFVSPPEIINNKILELLKELVEKTKDMSYLELNWFIFWNNLKVSFLGLISGIFFGIYPIIMGLFNGYVLGFVANTSVQDSGLISLFNILPHGIFELPALFLALGLGIKIGTFILKKDSKKTLIDYLKNSIKIFLFIILPLLFIASIIETGLIFFIK